MSCPQETGKTRPRLFGLLLSRFEVNLRWQNFFPRPPTSSNITVAETIFHLTSKPPPVVKRRYEEGDQPKRLPRSRWKGVLLPFQFTEERMDPVGFMSNCRRWEKWQHIPTEPWCECACAHKDGEGKEKKMQSQSFLHREMILLEYNTV